MTSGVHALYPSNMDINEYLKEVEKVSLKEFPEIYQDYCDSFSMWWNNLKNTDKEYVDGLVKRLKQASEDLSKASENSLAIQELKKAYEPSRGKS